MRHPIQGPFEQTYLEDGAVPCDALRVGLARHASCGLELVVPVAQHAGVEVRDRPRPDAWQHPDGHVPDQAACCWQPIVSTQSTLSDGVMDAFTAGTEGACRAGQRVDQVLFGPVAVVGVLELRGGPWDG